MDPEIANLIKTISIDAIKILGPAIIAAFATYKATKMQYEIRLAELTKGHEFKAREHLFDYYKDRQIKLSKSHEELNNALGQLLGMAAASQEHDEEDSINEMVDSFSGISNLYAELAPFEINTVLRDFESKDLNSTDEYTKLKSYIGKLEDIQDQRTYSNVKNNVYILLEVYSFLERCNQMLLEAQIKRIFSKYVGNV